MSSENKKSVKKTTAVQFDKLASYMEEFPHLATGSPIFGSSRAAMEHTWDTVAQKLNSYGPPERNGSEWKKVWQDQKSRLKKKIAENNKSLHGTGGGPCIINNLTALERDIDRICHLSSAAAPSGKTFGVSASIETMQFPSSSNKIVSVTPPRRNPITAVVSPTTSVTLKVQTQNVPVNLQPNKLLQTESRIQLLEQPQPITSTPKQSYPDQKNSKAINQPNRKRKIVENEKVEQIKLLRKQLEVQEKTLHVINVQAEAAQATATAVKNIAQSTSIIAQSLVDIVKYLKDDN